MEVILSIPWYYWLILIFTIIVCFFIGRFSVNNKYDGNVFIEPTEDEDRDRIRFVLEMELDDIKKMKKITFKVNNVESQNSQPV